MPDGDEVRSKLEGKYRSAYKHLCEGKTGDDELAHEVIDPTNKKIQDYGDEALQLISSIALEYEKVLSNKDQVDWQTVWKQVEKIAQETCMNKRAKHLVLHACRDLVEQLCNGKTSDSLSTDILHRYFQQIYRADFEAYVESGPDHMYNTSPDTVIKTLERMRPKVDAHLLFLAKQAGHQETLQNLKLPPRVISKNTDIALDANLLNKLRA